MFRIIILLTNFVLVAFIATGQASAKVPLATKDGSVGLLDLLRHRGGIPSVQLDSYNPSEVGRFDRELKLLKGALESPLVASRVDSVLKAYNASRESLVIEAGLVGYRNNVEHSINISFVNPSNKERVIVTIQFHSRGLNSDLYSARVARQLSNKIYYLAVDSAISVATLEELNINPPANVEDDGILSWMGWGRGPSSGSGSGSGWTIRRNGVAVFK